MNTFEDNLRAQVKTAVEEILNNYPNELPYVPSDMVDDLVELTLKMY